MGWVQRWAVPLVSLFVRLEPHQAADHLTRAAVLEALTRAAASGTRDLETNLGVNTGTLLWHLHVLERLGVVRSKRVGRVRLWYRTDRAAPRSDDLVRESSAEGQLVLEAITRHPGITISALSRQIGVAKSTVHRNVAKLALAGLVEVRRTGTRSSLYRTQHGRSSG
jgi:predicted transcriptional regulator